MDDELTQQAGVLDEVRTLGWGLLKAAAIALKFLCVAESSFGGLHPSPQPPAVATAAVVVNQMQASAPLLVDGDNAPALGAFAATLPAGAVVTLPAGVWPIKSTLEITKPVEFVAPENQTATLRLVGSPRIILPAAGVTFKGVVLDVGPTPPPPPIDPPPPPIDPPPPPVGARMAKANLAWTVPAAGVRWVNVQYTAGTYVSPLLKLAPEANGLEIRPPANSPLTMTFWTEDLDGAESGKTTARWQLGDLLTLESPPLVVTATPGELPSPTDPRLTIYGVVDLAPR